MWSRVEFLNSSNVSYGRFYSRSWASCENVTGLARAESRRRRERGEKKRSGVVEKYPESKGPGFLARSTGRTKDKCALESDVRTSSNCKTVLFDRSDTRGPRDWKGGGRGRAHACASRVHLPGRWGDLARRRRKGDGGEGERWRWLKGGLVSWVLYKLPRVDGDGEPRGSTSKSLFSGSARSAI